jgi:hypothetical protein
MLPICLISISNLLLPPNQLAFGFTYDHSIPPADIIGLYPVVTLLVSKSFVISTLPKPLNALDVLVVVPHKLFTKVFAFAENLVSSTLPPKSKLNLAVRTSPFE